MQKNMPIQHFAEEPTPFGHKLVYGAYSVENLIYSDLQYARFLTAAKTLCVKFEWLVDVSFELSEWVETLADNYIFDDAKSCMMLFDDGFIKAQCSRMHLSTEISGSPEFCKKMQSLFAGKFRKAESLIQWVYNDKGEEVQIPLNYRKGLNSAYPQFADGYEAFIDSYLNSDASVLILIGPPGSGKSTLLKNLIHRSKGNAKVAYDEKILANDAFFAGFMESDARFLVMEDADAFLTKRSDGNNMMHRFLNMSDGLISAADKKLVFSTNLPSVKDIDEALTRPGRCFDIVTFGALTREQADNVVKEAGYGVVPNKDKIMLSEIFAIQQNAAQSKPSRVGFI